MNAKQIYTKYTGKKQPTQQIYRYEWQKEYITWLENQVEELYNNHIHKLK
tara:strand:- start:390 stop:539 length:150 start_codon:yes stop_codon:yes gene_type:complete